jgi:hypothetical protein
VIKSLTVMLFAASSLFAQVTASVSNGVVTYTNASKQQVVAFVASVTDTDGQGSFPYSHEFYFKTNGMVPGESVTFDVIAPEDRASGVTLHTYTSSVTFVQYADGTTDGSKTSPRVADILGHRKDVTAMLQNYHDAYLKGPSAFLAELQKPQPAGTSMARMQRHIVSFNAGYGSLATFDYINAKLEAAKLREASGKF